MEKTMEFNKKIKEKDQEIEKLIANGTAAV